MGTRNLFNGYVFIKNTKQLIRCFHKRKILSGEEITDEELKNKADQNIINLTELYDLKSSKQGVLAFTGISLFLLIYCSKKNINTLPIIIIWLRYNLSYTYNKYKFTKDKKNLIITCAYDIGLVVTMILFFIKTL